MNINVSENCKYFFYIHLIDINQNVYKKTHFLFIDFIFKIYSSDDVFPIFEEMIKRKLDAHYLSEKEDIYKNYCYKKKFCDIVLQANIKHYKINDVFLEKHFSLILKLKMVFSSVGVNINFINNIFYNIDYITYICIGHGVSFFKYYLYKYYYGPQNFDKLLIPNSKKLISVPLKYGWKEENLIKLNLPRWNKYDIRCKSINKYETIESNSIFIMFTWRELKKYGNISLFYINNIIKLINNEKLINHILLNNLTIYFSLHHMIHKYQNLFNFSNNVKYIEENKIAECLSKTQLVVTDYSSIIFDMIYRRKPYIIFIPDLKDPLIKYNYKDFCYNIIKNLTLNDFDFQNIYFDISSTVNKINYYIDNNFELDMKLKDFYEEFNFTNGNSINELINYCLK